MELTWPFATQAAISTLLMLVLMLVFTLWLGLCNQCSCHNKQKSGQMLQFLSFFQLCPTQNVFNTCCVHSNWHCLSWSVACQCETVSQWELRPSASQVHCCYWFPQHSQVEALQARCAMLTAPELTNSYIMSEHIKSLCDRPSLAYGFWSEIVHVHIQS
jgi:hypothetical protein